MNQHIRTWKFIDRDTYRSLREDAKLISLADFASMQEPRGAIAARMSPSSYESLMLLNQRIAYALFGDCELDGGRTDNSDYLFEQVKCFLQDCEQDLDTFYEILTIEDNSFLVIVEKGFLHFLTQSKDTLLQYVLTCLGHLDRFKCDNSHLNRQYLRLSFIEGYHLLVKARAQS